MVKFNEKKLLSQVINSLTVNADTTYIFNKDQIGIVMPEGHYIIMGKFLSEQEFEETVKIVWNINKNLHLIPPQSMIPVKLRKLLLELTGESCIYACEDGLIGTTTRLKGYTLALTLPVWNEGETLQGVIESFLPVVDEIVIGIDNKTNDGSEAIAKLFTEDVFHFDWEKSFCKIRNACLEKCTSDWIFMTEGHEYLHESSYEHFKLVGSLIPQVSMVKVIRIIDGKHSEFPWLVRNNAGIQYINNSHNAVISKKEGFNYSVSIPEIKTYHERSEGKEQARRAQRKFMNRQNLLKDVMDNPNNSRAMFYLANEYFDFREYEKAVEWYKRYLQKGSWAEERYQAKLFCGKCLVMLGRKDEALEMFLSCFNEPVPRNDHLVVLADLYEHDYPDRSIYYLRMAASVEEPLSPMWVDPAFYREIPLQKLCIIYGSLGRLDDALTCAKLVKEKYPETDGVDDIIKKIEGALADESKDWNNGFSNFDIIKC